ncbi:hypothetical protein D478_13948 [Brevibacillus agri BAB-2500]|nr:hypothetical protein D478_13948 [Brevibacillus agri BAB-2500]
MENTCKIKRLAGVFLLLVQTVEKRCGRAGLSGLET